MLADDTSSSMAATDVTPDPARPPRAAAERFIATVPARSASGSRRSPTGRSSCQSPTHRPRHGRRLARRPERRRSHRDRRRAQHRAHGLARPAEEPGGQAGAGGDRPAVRRHLDRRRRPAERRAARPRPRTSPSTRWRSARRRARSGAARQRTVRSGPGQPRASCSRSPSCPAAGASPPPTPAHLSAVYTAPGAPALAPPGRATS